MPARHRILHRRQYTMIPIIPEDHEMLRPDTFDLCSNPFTFELTRIDKGTIVPLVGLMFVWYVRLK